MKDKAALLKDLAQAKATFQRRAIMAILTEQPVKQPPPTQRGE